MQIKRAGSQASVQGPADWFTGSSTAMTHIAIQEGLNGKFVDWMEHASDTECLAGNVVR